MGDDGDDIIGGGTGEDEIYGGDGADRLTGGDGRDLMFGDDGDDILGGGLGVDVMNGGDGDDRLVSGDGDDDVSGGAGDDILRAGEGDNRLNGGAGDDVISANGAGANTIVYEGGEFGDDSVYSYNAGVDRFEIDASLATSFDDIALEALNAQRTKISFAGETGSITVYGVAASAFSEDDFVIVGAAPMATASDDDEPVAAGASTPSALLAVEFGPGDAPIREDAAFDALTNDDALVV